VVTNLPSEWTLLGAGDISTHLRIAVTVLSLTLAILTGLANFRKPGDLWLTYRMTEELIKHEKYLFVTDSGPYHNNKQAAHDFVETIEAIISAEHNKFRPLVDPAKRSAAGHKEASSPADS
jgi:hypothetical protein